MGRGVDYLTNAEYVIYFTADWINNEKDEEGEYDYFLCQQNWDDFIGNLTSSICNKLKSYYEVDEWDGRETKIFLKNGLAEIGISEYCGLYSLSIRKKECLGYYSYEKDIDGLSGNHCQQVRKTLEKSLADSGATLLNKIGTFSNGESVYKLAK